MAEGLQTGLAMKSLLTHPDLVLLLTVRTAALPLPFSLFPHYACGTALCSACFHPVLHVFNLAVSTCKSTSSVDGFWWR